MGINAEAIARIIGLSKIRTLVGPAAMLGRQRVNRPGEVGRIMAVLADYKLPAERGDVVSSNRYADPLFNSLGLGQFSVIDLSDYEGATIALDLSKPISDEFNGSFSFVYDGGTTEHIFDLPCAYRNIDRMLRPGGTYVANVPFDGWPGHGFYQLQPSLVYSFWRDALGYKVDFCAAVSADHTCLPRSFELKDGHRRFWKLPSGMVGKPTSLCFGVTKGLGKREADVEKDVQQAFYVDVWRDRRATVLESDNQNSQKVSRQ